MKVHELIATLLTLPQEAEIYTEQFTSNEIAEVAFSESENLVIIGDDLDEIREFYPDMAAAPIKDTPTAASLKYKKTIGEKISEKTYVFYNRKEAEAAAKVLTDKILARQFKNLNSQDNDINLFIHRNVDGLHYNDESRDEMISIWVEKTCFCEDVKTVLDDFIETEAPSQERREY